MSSRLQARDIAFNVDKTFALQLMECAACCEIRTPAGSGDGFDFCLAGAPASGTGNQIAVNCQFVWCQTVMKNGGGAVEKMKPIFALHDSSEHKAYQRQMRGCSDLIPECFHNHVSCLPAERSFSITVSRTYELEAIHKLYDELESPVPEKMQRKLSEEGRKAWSEKAWTAHRKSGSAVQMREAMPIYPDDISEARINYFSGTVVTVSLGEGLLNFCYTDFDAAFEECMAAYLWFIHAPESAAHLDREKFGGNRETVIRAFELYEQVFPILSKVYMKRR